MAKRSRVARPGAPAQPRSAPGPAAVLEPMVARPPWRRLASRGRQGSGSVVRGTCGRRKVAMDVLRHAAARNDLRILSLDPAIGYAWADPRRPRRSGTRGQGPDRGPAPDPARARTCIRTHTKHSWEAVGLENRRLQIGRSGPFLTVFLAHGGAVGLHIRQELASLGPNFAFGAQVRSLPGQPNSRGRGAPDRPPHSLHPPRQRAAAPSLKCRPAPWRASPG